MTEHVLLVGMMGSGKTTTGRLVARLLGRPFRDSDDEILARTGYTVPEIFKLKGEAAFRAEEKGVLASALSSEVPSVIAVAGGAVFDPESRRKVRAGGPVIWLRAPPGTLADRVGPGNGRPLLENDPRGTLARLDAARRPVYQELADAVVDVNGIPPALVAERVARAARECLESPEPPEPAKGQRCSGYTSYPGSPS
jgi:shikimate kinase